MHAPDAAVTADVSVVLLIDIEHLPRALAEPVALLFDLLGWQVRPLCQAMFQPGECGSAAMPAPRLELRLEAGVITVRCADDRLAARLAATGLDRLVVPLSLPALEDLAALAGG